MKILENQQLRTKFNFWESTAFKQGQASHLNNYKCFDWVSAAKEIVRTKTNFARAALQDDVNNTLLVIYQNNKPIDKFPFRMRSTWATPILIIENVIYECFLDESEIDYPFNFTWPKCATEILKGRTNEVLN